MANYLITGCGGITLVVDSGENTLVIESVYFFSFTGGTESGCFTVTSESPDPINDGINSLVEYSNCLSCLQDNDFSFWAYSCVNPSVNGPVNAIQFNEWPIGNFYTLCSNDSFPFEGCFCFEIQGIYGPAAPFNFTITGPFNDCTCSRSSGNEYTECVICCDCGSTGSTVTQVSPPHPVWTDGYGTPVTQMNMVTLGGMFGLNN
jgi:hypothetical protein